MITQREKVGEVDQRPIWKVTGTEVISYQRTLLHLNEQQVTYKYTCTLHRTHVALMVIYKVRYGGGAGNTVEENSSVFSLI